MEWAKATPYSIRKGNAPKPQKKKFSKRKKITASALVIIAVAGAVIIPRLRTYAYTYYGGVSASAEGSGALTGNDPSSINAQESYNLTANTTKLWEVNLYPVNTTADITTNKGYLFVSKSQLPANSVDGQQTSFSGGWGNPEFVEHTLMSGSQHEWVLEQSGGSNLFPASNTDYYALSDITNINGMKDSTPFNVVVNGQTQAFYEPQTPLTIANVALPHITTPLLDSAYQGSQVSTVSGGNTYWLNPSMFTAYGSNGGGFFSQNYFSAYWVPVVNGTPDTSAATYAFAQNDNGSKTVYDWPSVTQVIDNGGLSSASGYGSGFGGKFELVANTSAPTSPGQLEVSLPSTAMPTGTTSMDLVTYYGDGVQRYDAQVANFSVPTPPAPTCSTPPSIRASATSSTKATVTVSDPSGDSTKVTASTGTLTNTANGQSGTSLTVTGNATLTDTVSNGTPSATFTGVDTTNSACVIASASVSFPSAAPSITLTLTANPTSLNTGSTSTLTAKFTGTMPSNAAIYIHDMSSDSTLSGTNVQEGMLGATSFTTTAVDSTAQQVEYKAAVDIKGAYFDSSLVYVTWNTPSTSGLTLSANPTSLNVGSGSTLTASYSGSVSIGSNSIIIHDLGGKYTLNNGGTTTYTGFSGQPTVTTTALANSAYTESYDATVVNANGQTETSNTISVTWSTASTAPPTIPNSTGLTLVCAPGTLPVGNATTCTATVAPNPTGGAAPSGEFVGIWDATTGQYLYGVYTGSSNMTYTMTASGQTESFSTTYTSNSGGLQNFTAGLWYPGQLPGSWTP